MSQVDEAAAARLHRPEDQVALPAPADSGQRDFSQALLPEEGVEVFQRILFHNSLPQMAVCTRNLSALMLQINEAPQARLGEKADQPASPGGGHPRPKLRSSYAAPRNETEEKLASIWQQLLGIAQVGIHDNFFEMGGHSLLAIQALSRIRQAFQLEISLHELFEVPTVAGLAQRIEAASLTKPESPGLPIPAVPHEEQLPAHVDQLSDQEVYNMLADLLAAEQSQEAQRKDR